MLEFPRHFTYRQMTHSRLWEKKGLSNAPTSWDHRLNLWRTATVLESIRHKLSEHLGKDTPIIVTSGYRSAALNAEIGGARNSAHTRGLAADLRCPSLAPYDLALFIHNCTRHYDQVILEFGSWVHFGLRESNPREQRLTAVNRNNKTHYLNGLIENA